MLALFVFYLIFLINFTDIISILSVVLLRSRQLLLQHFLYRFWLWRRPRVLLLESLTLNMCWCVGRVTVCVVILLHIIPTQSPQYLVLLFGLEDFRLAPVEELRLLLVMIRLLLRTHKVEK